jgi:hypothetical protein
MITTILDVFEEIGAPADACLDGAREVARRTAALRTCDHQQDREAVNQHAEEGDGPVLPLLAQAQAADAACVDLVICADESVELGRVDKDVEMVVAFRSAQAGRGDALDRLLAQLNELHIFLVILTKSHFLRLDPNRRLSGSLRRDAPFLLTRIARVDSLVSQLIRDLEGELKLAVRQVTVCLDDG